MTVQFDLEVLTTTVNRIDVTDLNGIMNLSLLTVDIFDLVNIFVFVI